MTGEIDKSSWNWRMAESLENCQDPQLIHAMLEAAGELKAAKLKVMLGRALQVIEFTLEHDVVPAPNEVKDLLEGIKREI